MIRVYDAAGNMIGTHEHKGWTQFEGLATGEYKLKSFHVRGFYGYWMLVLGGTAASHTCQVCGAVIF